MPNTPSAIPLAPPPTLGIDAHRLPALGTSDLAITEAAPQPPAGPERDRLEEQLAARITVAEDALAQAVTGYLTRLGEVVLARLRGPRARKGTRWWSLHEGKAAVTPRPPGIEVKALDPEYIVPDALVDELDGAARPVALRIARDAASDTARRLGAEPRDVTGDGMFAVDENVIANAVENAIAELLGVAGRHAEEIRKEVLGADSSAESLDEVLDRVEQAHRRGGNWVLLRGRTLATALVNESALAQAIALGCTHKQWISKRDDRVRRTHAVVTGADGQVRPVDQPFNVGHARLMFPGDPSGLPTTWPEIANCRCSMLFRRPEDTAGTIEQLAESDRDGRARLVELVRELGGAEQIVVSPAALGLPPAAAVPGGPPVPGAPVTAWRLPLPEQMVGYRALVAALPDDVVPGQQLRLVDGVVLGLVAPDVPADEVLRVLVPAGTQVIVLSTGVLIVPGATTLEIVAVSAAGVQATLAPPAGVPPA